MYRIYAFVIAVHARDHVTLYTDNVTLIILTGRSDSPFSRL